MDYGISSCPITLDDFTNGEEIICLPCKHIFNPDAIKNWISQNNNCPVCRLDIAHENLETVLFIKAPAMQAPAMQAAAMQAPAMQAPAMQAAKFVVCILCSKSKYRNSYKGLDKNFKCSKCRIKKTEANDANDDLTLAYSLLIY